MNKKKLPDIWEDDVLDRKQVAESQLFFEFRLFTTGDSFVLKITTINKNTCGDCGQCIKSILATFDIPEHFTSGIGFKQFKPSFCKICLDFNKSIEYEKKYILPISKNLCHFCNFKKLLFQ